jgi:hypothetical protein
MNVDLIRANRLLHLHKFTPWQTEYTISALVMLQIGRPEPSPEKRKDWLQEAQDWLDAFEGAHDCGELDDKTVESQVFGEDGEQIPGAIRIISSVTASNLSRWMAKNGQQPSTLLAAWFESQKLDAEPFRKPTETVFPAWQVTRNEREDNFTRPLYLFLSGALSEGKQRPTARCVLDAWREKKPPKIFEVMADELKYLDTNDKLKALSLKAINAAIGRMTKTVNAR